VLRHNSVRPKLAALALLFSANALLFSGCQKSESARPSNQAADSTSTSTPEPQSAKAAAAPEAQIYVDEAMLRKPFAVIGGTVENVGGERLENLLVEIELRRRADGTLERREVSVKPGDLEPGEQGRYSIRVLSEEWSGSRVVSLRSGARAEEVVFKTLPGAKRPPERIPEKKITVVEGPRRKKSQGEEFINTPDTPIPVP
jgi:hypothetical protein